MDRDPPQTQTTKVADARRRFAGVLGGWRERPISPAAPAAVRTVRRTRASAVLRLLPAVAWMGVIFALSSRRRLPAPPGLGPDLTALAGHFAVYAVLAALLWRGLAIPGLPARRRLALAFAGAVAYGVSDEWRQSFVPGRDPSLVDVTVDALGALGALAGIAFVVRGRGETAADAANEPPAGGR